MSKITKHIENSLMKCLKATDEYTDFAILVPDEDDQSVIWVASERHIAKQAYKTWSVPSDSNGIMVEFQGDWGKNPWVVQMVLGLETVDDARNWMGGN
jgi:hypothetical protein